jgi:hypothetical protein
VRRTSWPCKARCTRNEPWITSRPCKARCTRNETWIYHRHQLLLSGEHRMNEKSTISFQGIPQALRKVKMGAKPKLLLLVEVLSFFNLFTSSIEDFHCTRLKHVATFTTSIVPDLSMWPSGPHAKSGTMEVAPFYSKFLMWHSCTFLLQISNVALSQSTQHVLLN